MRWWLRFGFTMFNTNNGFGFIAIFLHWAMALVIFGLFAVGLYMVELTYYDSLYKTLPFIHKSVGILLALTLVFRIVWKLINRSPDAAAGVTAFEHLAARLVHVLLYGLMVAIVVSGYLISTADGSAISVFDWFDVPATLTSIPEQEDVAGEIHEYLAYTIIALVALHAAAALKHHFVNKDNTLRRMLGVRS